MSIIEHPIRPIFEVAAKKLPSHRPRQCVWYGDNHAAIPRHQMRKFVQDRRGIAQVLEYVRKNHRIESHCTQLSGDFFLDVEYPTCRHPLLRDFSFCCGMCDAMDFAPGILGLYETGVIACTAPDIEHSARFIVEQRKQWRISMILVNAILSLYRTMHKGCAIEDHDRRPV